MSVSSLFQLFSCTPSPPVLTSTRCQIKVLKLTSAIYNTNVQHLVLSLLTLYLPFYVIYERKEISILTVGQNKQFEGTTSDIIH